MHSVIPHQISHIIALYFESWVSSTWGRVEIKNSDPKHQYALYRVYYPTHLLPKIIGCITFNSLGQWCTTFFGRGPLLDFSNSSGAKQGRRRTKPIVL